MKQIDTYTYTGKGYNPFLIDKDWQIAQLNFEEGQGFHDLKKNRQASVYRRSLYIKKRCSCTDFCHT